MAPAVGAVAPVGTPRGAVAHIGALRGVVAPVGAASPVAATLLLPVSRLQHSAYSPQVVGSPIPCVLTTIPTTALLYSSGSPLQPSQGPRPRFTCWEHPETFRCPLNRGTDHGSAPPPLGTSIFVLILLLAV
jgi:hypothetical protein